MLEVQSDDLLRTYEKKAKLPSAVPKKKKPETGQKLCLGRIMHRFTHFRTLNNSRPQIGRRARVNPRARPWLFSSLMSDHVK